MDRKRFYDIHYHAMDLSHANMTAFTDRYVTNPVALEKWLRESLPRWKKVLYSIAGGAVMPLIGTFMPYSGIARRITNLIQKQSKVRNLLSFMESSVLYDFLVVEWFLKHGREGESAIIGMDNTFRAGEQNYNRIVLCPLVMDFGFPQVHNKDIYYNIPPQKPVTSQVSDLFSAIRTYYEKSLVLREENGITIFDVENSTRTPEDRLFEIYPFMGINTKNYSLKKVEDMLNKYFSGFSGEDTPDMRYTLLHEKMGVFSGDLDDPLACRNIFAGIKLYPPLGFDPWPDEPEEREKVELLYSVAVEKNIPVITHCSTGGFVASSLAHRLTSPLGQWAKALEAYPKLKIDFAHFGEDDPAWISRICELALSPEHRVWTDMSSNGDNPAYYRKVRKLADAYGPVLEEKILYGTDFMINLLNVKSYNEYMSYFLETPGLSEQTKNAFCSVNPERFLFGK